MTRPRKTILRRKDKVYKRIKALKSILMGIVLLYFIILLIISSPIKTLYRRSST